MAVDWQTIGSNIEARRVRAGMTKTALAQAAGVSLSSISQIEAGKQHASLDTLAAVAKALNIRFDRIYPGNGAGDD